MSILIRGLFVIHLNMSRIDELDYTPHPLPLSKSKLKRLKKQNRVPQQEDGSNVSRPHD